MTWTTTPPTEPGWYWAKSTRWDSIEVVQVDVGFDVWSAGSEEWYEVEDFAAWAGPLTPPEET